MQHLIESGTDIETLAKKKVDKERGLISMEDAVEEVIADSCEMMLENTQVPQMMAKENPGLFAQIREWLAEFAAKLRRAFEGVKARSAEAQAMMQYAEELQQMWDNALAGAAQNVRNNTQTEADNGTNTANNGTTSGKNKRNIREIGDTGMRYVKADRQVLFGNDPREWGEQLTKYINKEIRKGNDVLLTAPDGEIIKLTATTAEKGAFRNTWYDNSGIPHLLTDAEYETKLNAEAHIDELVQVSEDRRKGRPNAPDDNGIHGSFAKDGWRYRGAYFMDHDGKYYEVTISVAHGANGKVAYNIAEIKKRSFPEKNGSSNPKTGAQSGKASLDARVSQPAGEVKGKSSMRDNTTDDTAAERKDRQESYANLRAENAKLREQLDYWKGQTKLTKEKTVRKADVDAYAKRLTEQLNNPKAREQVADEIKRMGDYIVQTPGSELSYTEVKDYALVIADFALQDSQTVIDDSQADKVQSGISQYLGNEVVPKMSGANRAFVNSFVKLHVKIALTASEKRRKQRKSARGETTQTIDIKGKVRSFNDFGLSLKWSECNYRISENADISMVCWQSARGIYSKRLKFRGIPLKSEFERSFPQV